MRNFFKKIKEALKKFWNWLCTPSGMLALLAVCGVSIVGGCGLVLFNRKRKRADTGRISAGTTAGNDSGDGTASLGGSLRTVTDTINRLQSELASGIDQSAERFDSKIGELDICNERLEEGISELSGKLGELEKT